MNGKGVAGTVTQGRVVAREAGRLARELLRISLGSSSVAPARGTGGSPTRRGTRTPSTGGSGRSAATWP